MTVVGALILAIASFSALGGLIASYKHRPPVAGFLRGLLLGPIGVAIELRAPYNHRPIVDERSINSLQSLLLYQENSQMPEQAKEKV